MAPAFPVLPRSQVPRVRVSDDEFALRKQQAEQLLHQTLQAYDDFVDRSRSQIDAKRWKQETAKDRLKLFKERKPAATDKRAYLLTGETSGRVEDALYAFSCESHIEHALLTQFLYEDIADCSLLRMLENARDDDPYRSLAYKWFVKASGMSKSRDVVYLEYSGTTCTKNGKEIGFHVLHTVELAQFPEFRDRQCVRTPRGETISTLFRQMTENTVEVFMQASLDASTGRGLFSSSSSSSASVFSPDTLVAIASNSISCGEAKRLTMLIEECRQIRASQSRQPSMYNYHEEAILCSMCRQEKKKFNAVTLTDCEVCSATICNKCRENRRIFVYGDRTITGKFDRVSCCQTCAFNAARIRPEVPAWAKRESSSTTSSNDNASASYPQTRSGSVASTVTSDMASSFDAFAIGSSSVRSSAFPTEGEDDISSAQVNKSMARLSIDVDSRVSVDSVDFINVVDRNEHDSHDISSLVVSTKRPSRPTELQGCIQTPDGMDSQAAYTHQMQLYLRMQQLTQLAEQTYHTARQQGPIPPPPMPKWPGHP